MDTGCGAILIDQNWLKSQLSKAKILKMTTMLKVRGIGTSKHETDKYVLEALYFPAISNKGQHVVACICRELHFVDNLRANILIKNVIIGAKSITIDIAKEKAYILGCKATIPITARQYGQLIKRTLYLTTCVIIPPRLQAFVSTNLLSLLPNKDFYFKSVQQLKLSLFAHLVTYDTKSILV